MSKDTELIQPLARRDNPTSVKAASDILRADIKSYLEDLTAEQRAVQLSVILGIAYEQTVALVELKPALGDEARAAVSGLTRSFKQRANWLASNEI